MSDDKSNQGQVNQVKGTSVKGALETIFGRFRPDTASNINGLVTIDKNIGLITRLANPKIMSALDLVAQDALKDGFPELSESMQTLAQAIRVNNCAEGGWRAEQFVKIYSSMAQGLANSDGEGEPLKGKERITGRGGKR